MSIFENSSMDVRKFLRASLVGFAEDYLKQFDQESTFDKYFHQFRPEFLGRTKGEKWTLQAKLTPAYAYLEAPRTNREKISESSESVLKEVEALVTPATPLLAIKMQEAVETELRGKKVNTRMALGCYLTLFSVTGMPAITVPAGWTTG